MKRCQLSQLAAFYIPYIGLLTDGVAKATDKQDGTAPTKLERGDFLCGCVFSAWNIERGGAAHKRTRVSNLSENFYGFT